MATHRCVVHALSCAVVVAASTAGPLAAQGVPTLDTTVLAPVTGSGKFLVYWAAEDGASGEQGIYLKNISPDRSITITSWEVYDCIKLAGGICGKRNKGPTIKPGKKVRLILIRGWSDGHEGFAYRFRFTQQWTDELPPQQ